jgi:hypothetical protein
MKRTPLNRKSPLKRRRDSIRVTHPERVQHNRMKRERVSKTAIETQHLARLAAMPCIVTGKRPVEVHHLMRAPNKRTRRDHQWAVPLHYLMHRGPAGIHGLGSEELFEREHGLAPGFLIAWAAKAWEETCRKDIGEAPPGA